MEIVICFFWYWRRKWICQVLIFVRGINKSSDLYEKLLDIISITNVRKYAYFQGNIEYVIKGLSNARIQYLSMKCYYRKNYPIQYRSFWKYCKRIYCILRFSVSIIPGIFELPLFLCIKFQNALGFILFFVVFSVKWCFILSHVFVFSFFLSNIFNYSQGKPRPVPTSTNNFQSDSYIEYAEISWICLIGIRICRRKYTIAISCLSLFVKCYESSILRGSGPLYSVGRRLVAVKPYSVHQIYPI